MDEWLNEWLIDWWFSQTVIQHEHYEMGAFRWGVGKVIAKLSSTLNAHRHRDAVVVPFVIRGMKDVKPLGVFWPQIGHKVRVLVGEPINFSDLILAHFQMKQRHEKRGLGDPFDPHDERLFAAITARIVDRMKALNKRIDELMEAEDEMNHERQRERKSKTWHELIMMMLMMMKTIHLWMTIITIIRSLASESFLHKPMSCLN